ncbi:acyl-CoA dehydrogenase [Leptolyngbya sp. AN03gr2]|uniref:acyl-CoA dehydrogenase n=1 Tax=unclassified Leptolyngbya TaxID=2650499 RepID=UPI003D320217
MLLLSQLTILILLLLTIGFIGVPLWVWLGYSAIALFIFAAPLWLWSIYAAIALILSVPQIRRPLLTTPIMKVIRVPKISDTERAAINAGTVWVEGEFFSGAPDFERINQAAYPEVTPELQAFLDQQVEQVCRMATDWEIHQHKDLPVAVWQYLKQERFFGMMIPVEYGGLGFSNFAYSSVMAKLASRSFIHTATVGVTNSLGPAKLLLNYGTSEQKAYYLPRLASGEEIPCFALTEPTAGSDAASITAKGTVFQDDEGKLMVRLNFRKRYITLGAIATLIGLAFKLSDPDNLLGKGEEVGITCILIPANTKGMILGKRHDPMGVPFYNSPVKGQNVIVSVDQIIGGVEQAGQGWKMLMQSLAAGRGISFPASCTGVAKLVARVTGAYSKVRQQFGSSIGRFEGIEEPLARIGGLTYLLDAARIYTVGAVDAGEKPAVVSAIAKYQFTETTRKLVNDGMDILGGSGICRGSRNLLANFYIAMPIPITVEGSNILTRTLMIFGQGVIRCHPYLYSEIKAIETGDTIAFDQVLWKHIGSITRNKFRTLLLSLSRGYLAPVPGHKFTKRYYQKLAWSSAMFALLTDFLLVRLGGSLKRHEKLTGRLADWLSWMYLSSATLRRFAAEGDKPADLILVQWAMDYSFAQMQQALEGILVNLPIPRVARSILISFVRVNPLGTLPTDRLGSQVAQALQTTGEDRDRLTAGIYLPKQPDEALGRLEQAFKLCEQAEVVISKIRQASRAGQLLQEKGETLIEAALKTGVITEAEADLIRLAETARLDAIQVDAFTMQEYQHTSRIVDRYQPELCDRVDRRSNLACY